MAIRAAQRPLLLVDVDGVLQPIGNSIPPGFERFSDDSSTVTLCPRHGEWLLQLATAFELTWASTWAANANNAIGRRLGLPALPHIELSGLPREGTRKLAAVQRYVGHRAVAWLDDELYEDATTWAEGRGAPTLLIRTAGAVGMTSADVDQLEEFARECS